MSSIFGLATIPKGIDPGVCLQDNEHLKINNTFKKHKRIKQAIGNNMRLHRALLTWQLSCKKLENNVQRLIITLDNIFSKIIIVIRIN